MIFCLYATDTMNKNSFNMEAPSRHTMILDRDTTQQIILACDSFSTHGYYFFHSESFTFSGAVDGAVVSSFGHLQHPCPQQVFIGTVCWCVTPRALEQKQEQAQKSTTKLHLPTHYNFYLPKNIEKRCEPLRSKRLILTHKQL